MSGDSEYQYAQVEPLFRFLRKKFPKIPLSRAEVPDYVFKDSTANQIITRIVTHKFPRLKTISWGFNHQWQADLVDYGFGKWMILVVIDLFSRQVDAEITRSKNASSILRAFNKIVERRVNPR